MIENEDMIDHSHITDVTDKNKTDLRAQISVITQREQEIQNLITSIENAVQWYEGAIQLEQGKPKPNYKTMGNMRLAVSKNIELLATLYGTYKQFEDVKFKYFKQISDLDMNTQRLIEVDIKRLESKLDHFTGGEFIDMMRQFTTQMKYADRLQVGGGNPPIVDESQAELDDNPEYKL